MRATDLRHKVRLEQPVAATADSYGDREPDTWSLVAEVFAKVERLSGNEAFRAAQVHPEVNSQVTIRYRTDVSPAWRVKHGTSELYIVAVIPDAREREQCVLLCREVV